MRAGLLFLVVTLTALTAQAADEPPGLTLFNRNCAACHDHAQGRIPPTASLKLLPSTTILQALETGVMRTQGESLNATDKTTLAAYLGVAQAFTQTAGTQICTEAQAGSDWPGWSPGAANWRFQPAEAAGLTVAQIPKLKLRWAIGLPATTNVRSQPTIWHGRLYIGAQDGSILSLNAQTGCTYWTTKVVAMVRTAVAIGIVNGQPVAVAGDVTGTLYALDALTGKLLWKRRLGDHPATMITATPVFHNDRLYAGTSSYEEVVAKDYVCCTFRGSISALNAADGTIIWTTYTIPEPAKPQPDNAKGRKVLGPSGAGVWASATVDAARNLLYVPTGDNYSDPPTAFSDALLALDLDTGRLAWSKQLTKGDAYNTACNQKGAQCPDSNGPDHDLGASPVLIGHTLLLGQKSGVMTTIDLDKKGEIVWQTRVGAGGPLGGIQWGPATDGKLVYVPVSDVGTKQPGGISALRVDTGAIVWQTPDPAPHSAAVTAIPGVVFSGSLDAHMRAYNAESGKVIWDFNASQEFPTINGIKAKGGAFDAAGPAVAGGMLFVGSGYGQWGGPAGNVLLAFSPEESPAPRD
jgi:polyvinyl alcohol dehydrogenase (cytochrome)